MKILTFADASNIFGVSSATISRWVKDGKLTQGPKAGKQKTVTQESVDTLAADSAFQIGRESAKNNNSKRIIAQIYAKKEELEDVKQRLEKLENLIEGVVVELRKVTQNNETKSKFLRNYTQNNNKNDLLKKGRGKTKKKD